MIMSESEGDEIIVVYVVLHSFFKARTHNWHIRQMHFNVIY